MFLSEHVHALFKKGNLKLIPTDDGARRVAEATFIIEPFPADLAKELGQDVAMHLYENDGAIVDALESVDLRVRVPLQRVTVRNHPDLDPLVTLNNCSVQDCSASRIEGAKTGKAWLAFQFVLVFDLATKEHRNFVIDEFGHDLYLTFKAVQQEMAFDEMSEEERARIKKAAARLAQYGDVELRTPEGSVRIRQRDAERLKSEAKELRRRTH